MPTTNAKYLASITLPVFSNDGESLEREHAYLQRELATVYGGWTRTNGMGGWVDKGATQIEQVSIYSVAVSRDEFTINHLLQLAELVGRMAGQFAMFVTLPNNEVRLLDLTTEGR